MCLECGNFGCNRELKSHGVAHFEATGHPLALQVESKAVWCYKCDSFIPLLKDAKEHQDILLTVQELTTELLFRSNHKKREPNHKNSNASSPGIVLIPTEALSNIIAKVNEKPGS